MTPLINSQIILPDTSLCAIVRDEIMNPAGGIVDFVDSTLPYVEAGVIVDTGSKDGTREALEEMKLKYSHLEVYDYPNFQSYGDARNLSLEKCRTKKILVLDADERLTRRDFHVLFESMNSPFASSAYDFDILNIWGDSESQPLLSKNPWNPRLFESKGAIFHGNVWECVSGVHRGENIGVVIKHFRPSLRDCVIKYDFYEQFQQSIKKTEIKPLREFPFFQDLKKYNPKREDYR